jgi:hypothetical protein
VRRTLIRAAAAATLLGWSAVGCQQEAVVGETLRAADGGVGDAGPQDGGRTGAVYPLFTAPGNIWTTPLGPNAPLDPNSAAIVSNLVTQINYRNHPSIAWYIDAWYTSVGTDWQRIWDVIPADSPPKRVLWIGGDGNPVDPDSQGLGGTPPLQSWIDAVPIPDLPIDTLRSQDGGFILYQQATDTLWELWGLRNANIVNGYYQAPDGSRTLADYTCAYAGRIRPASQSNGVFPLETGSSATSLPYANGLLMIRDVLAGVIDHALTLTVAVAGPPVAPATRGDPKSVTRVDRQQDQVSYGTLFRLPPTFDPASFAPGAGDRSVLLRLVLTAIRDYGLYVADAGPCMNLNGEGRTVIDQDSPYYDLTSSAVPSWWGAEGIFWGTDNITLAIPWDQLEVVAPHSSRSW